MRKNIRKVQISILLIIALLSSVLFSSCGTKIKDAKATVENFCNAIAEDNFEKAVGFIHSSKNVTAKKLKNSISSDEDKYGIDFSDGVEFVQCTNMFSNHRTTLLTGYSSEVTLEFKIKIGDAELDLYTLVLSDNAGSGIVNFEISMKSDSII